MFQMPECSQVSYSIVMVMLRQMTNRQRTSSLCLGAMWAHSSGVGVRHAFVGEQVVRLSVRMRMRMCECAPRIT